MKKDQKDVYIFNHVEYPRVSNVLSQIENPGLVMWKINLAIEYIKNVAYKDTDGGFDFDNPEKSTNMLLITLEELEKAKTAWKDVSQEALDTGSEVHNIIEKYIKYGRDSIGETNDQVTKALLAFFDWERDNNVKWIESEKPIFSKEHGYAGTLDAIAEVNGEITVIDFKTAKAIYPSYWMQVIAYAKARQDITLYIDTDKATFQMALKHHDSINVQYEGVEGLVDASYDHIQPVNCGILRLDKDTGLPEWKCKPMSSLEDEFTAFLGLLQYYYHIAKRRLSNNEFGKNKK